MKFDSKILVAGSKGLVGSAIVRYLHTNGYLNIIEGHRDNVDFTNQQQTADFFAQHKPDYVFLAAAKVGGILANSKYPATFIHDNLLIQTNIIHQSYLNSVKKLLFLGSSCIYPKHSIVPITEDQLLTGRLEPTNEAYATAKIAGIQMCQAYRKQYGFNAIAVMPTNLYGPNDNYELETAHVLPAMIRKFELAKQQSADVVLWGDGSPKREFLHVDDLAAACVLCMQKYDNQEIINIGTGEDISIRELADIVAEIEGFEGNVVWDTTKPNGTPRKVLNIEKIKSLGWSPKIPLESGIRQIVK